MKKIIFLVYFFFVFSLVFSCRGESGVDGINGKDGKVIWIPVYDPYIMEMTPKSGTDISYTSFNNQANSSNGIVDVNKGFIIKYQSLSNRAGTAEKKDLKGMHYNFSLEIGDPSYVAVGSRVSINGLWGDVSNTLGNEFVFQVTIKKSGIYVFKIQLRDKNGKLDNPIFFRVKAED